MNTIMPIDECCGQVLQPQRLDLRENLQRKKERLEVDLANITKAIEALDAHPEVAEVIRLISRV